jgi:DNA mismatch repair protein MutL
MYLLYLEIDPTQIDINIHPTKTEIKFQDERAVYAIVHAAVRRALGKFSIAPSLDFDQENAISISPVRQNAAIQPPKIDINPNFNPFGKSTESSNRSLNLRGWFDTKEKSASGWQDLMEVAAQIDREKETVTSLELEVGDEMFFIQHNRKYLICSSGERAMIIDQQRAHQRIRFEKFMTNISSGKAQIQQSLFPASVELTPLQASLFDSLTPELEAVGFRFSKVGATQIELTGVPSEFVSGNGEEAFSEALSSLENEVEMSNVSRENLCWKLAASGSIRHGQLLTIPEMQSLFQQLMECVQPFYWKNNKPIIVQFDAQQLNEYFK